jgi:hypothetical protein
MGVETVCSNRIRYQTDKLSDENDMEKINETWAKQMRGNRGTVRFYPNPMRGLIEGQYKNDSKERAVMIQNQREKRRHFVTSD